MDKDYLRKIAGEFSENSPTNYLSPIATTEEELAKVKELYYANNFGRNNAGRGNWDILNQDKPDEYIGMRFYNPPLLAFGSANDPGFQKLREPGVIGPHHYLPSDWLPGAKTVISIFVPFADNVVESNTKDINFVSWEWRFTRIDGQQHLLATGALIRDTLIKDGYKAIMPQAEDAYWAKIGEDGDASRPLYSTNWAERHVGWVTGLGTFGLHTNFISKAGTCGRLMSVITDWEAEPDKKDYEGIYDYCSKCNVCLGSLCGALSATDRKDISKCGAYIRKMNEGGPVIRVGCGKCMAGMPCATKSCGP